MSCVVGGCCKGTTGSLELGRLRPRHAPKATQPQAGASTPPQGAPKKGGKELNALWPHFLGKMWTWTSSTVATLTTLATLATALAAMATQLTITVWRIHTQAHSERTAAAARLSLKLTVYLTDYARNSPGRGHLISSKKSRGIGKNDGAFTPLVRALGEPFQRLYSSASPPLTSWA